MRRRVAIGLVLLTSGAWPTLVLGDGGTLREWKRLGGYEIAVFTDPTPVVTGPVDISVLLLDPANGEPVADASVTVQVAPVGQSGRAVRRAATSEEATNKLLRAALFDLQLSGRYAVHVAVEGPKGRAATAFEMNVAHRSTPSPGIWAWILWPLPVIALYVAHRRLVRSMDRSRHRVRSSDAKSGS